MDPHLEADILAASQALLVPGAGERRVLVPAAVERLAASCEWPRWKLEALALEMDIAPLHYLRNLARFGTQGQARLLRASVALVGQGAALERALELLAVNGTGRLFLLVPAAGPEAEPQARRRAEGLAAMARNRNASCGVTAGAVRLKEGNPAEAVRGAEVVASCLQDSMEEQLLQFACRMNRAPLVLAGVERNRGQATTIFPGDAGVALVYKPSHPHLAPRREGVETDARASLVVGTWICEQVTRTLLKEEEVLRHRLLYADLDSGEMGQYGL